jgi:uncharacterized protein (TIGR02453 family)
MISLNGSPHYNRPMAFSGFDRAFFTFLKQLKAHNTREWFADHKAQYQQDVEGPALAFVADLAPKLKKVSPRFIVDPRRSGGSMFRIYRDTRFSHDKSPYKTHVGLRFWHDGADLESPPSFYLHLEPGEIFGGGGCWHPDPVTLRKIRARIHEAPKEWKAVLATGLEIEGSTLKRVPAGFPPDHPFATDLMRKDHFASEMYTAADAGSPALLDRFVETCRHIAPLMRFLTAAQGQRW